MNNLVNANVDEACEFLSSDLVVPLKIAKMLEAENQHFREELEKLKKHLGREGEYCITRADGEPMSWESLVVSDIFEKLDKLLENRSK